MLCPERQKPFSRANFYGRFHVLFTIPRKSWNKASLTTEYLVGRQYILWQTTFDSYCWSRFSHKHLIEKHSICPLYQHVHEILGVAWKFLWHPYVLLKQRTGLHLSSFQTKIGHYGYYGDSWYGICIFTINETPKFFPPSFYMLKLAVWHHGNKAEVFILTNFSPTPLDTTTSFATHASPCWHL